MYDENFDKLVEKYNPIILKLIKNKFVDGYAKEDLHQECLMILDRCNHDFDDTKSVKFSTYLYTSVRNHLFTLIRIANRLKKPDITYTSYEDSLLLNAMHDDSDDVDVIENAKLFSSIVTDLLDLPRGYITYMIYVGVMTMKQVTAVEGVSEQRIHYLNKNNLRKIREKRALTV